MDTIHLYIPHYHIGPLDGARKKIKKCRKSKKKKKKKGGGEAGEGRECGLMGLERWEGSRKVKLTFLRRGRPCGRGFVNELVCMAGTTQWPRARSWHATDTRLKLTLTPQIITFSLWKLALPSHSSHSVSVALLSPVLFLFLTSPRLLWYISEEEWCWLWKAITCHLPVSLSLW